MLDELKTKITTFRGQLTEMEDYLEIAEKRTEQKRLEAIAAEPEFWNDQNKAQANIAATKSLKMVLDPLDAIGSGLDDAEVMLELADAGEEEALAEAALELKSVEKNFESLEMQSLLGEEFDANGAYLTLHAGAGGTESCDWADMLYRMFSRFAERKDFKVQIMDYQAGEEAGIKSVSILISGAYAYGLLKSERGVHRLVRISPYDSQSRRHTSFVAADVTPEIDDDMDVEIVESDCVLEESSGERALDGVAGLAGCCIPRIIDAAISIELIPPSIEQERTQQQQHPWLTYKEVLDRRQMWLHVLTEVRSCLPDGMFLLASNTIKELGEVKGVRIEVISYLDKEPAGQDSVKVFRDRLRASAVFGPSTRVFSRPSKKKFMRRFTMDVYFAKEVFDELP